MSNHMLSISCKVARNKLSCQFDAANIAALSRNNICDLAQQKSQQLVGKKKIRTITLCFASVIKSNYTKLACY